MPNPCNVLKITDGTTSVNLLNPAYGIHLAEWEPQIQQPKGGGIFQDSPLAPGRKRVYSKFANSVETFEFKVDGLTQNQILGRLTDLITLLEAMVEYWETDFNNTPVYLEVQTEGGNTQYAIIKSYTFPDLDNPFAQPFLPFLGGRIAMDELDLEIERGEWTANIPGSSVAINLLLQELNGTAYENANVFVANKWVSEGITHIYVDDGGVFGANQVNSTAFNLLPAVPAVNDAVYFGNDTPIILSNLVFDLDGNGTGYTAQWEVHTGGSPGTWVTITGGEIDDNTSTLQGSGIVSVSWNPADQAQTTIAVNGVTAYWIRLRVTAITVPVGPAQQNRPVFYQHYPYIEIPADKIEGTIESLIRNWVYYRGPFTAEYLSRFIIGTRQTNRGDGFVAFINWSDRAQPTGISINVSGSAYATRLTAPTGRALYDSALGISATHGTIIIDETIADQYIGKFRLYMVVERTATNADIDMRVFCNLDVGNVELFVTGVQTLPAATVNPTLIDFGEVEIYPTLPGATFGTDIEFKFEVDGNSSDDLYAITMILLPVDELAMNIEFIVYGSGGSGGVGAQSGGFVSFLEISSLNPREPIFAWTRDEADSDKYLNPPVITPNNSLRLKSETELRMWIFSSTYLSLGSGYGVATGDCSHLLEATMNTNPIYLSLRGDK